MTKKYLSALVFTALLAISGAGVSGAQAAPIGPGLPLSPASQQNVTGPQGLVQR
jgi:hypothetical protein